MIYNPSKIEKKWQTRWQKENFRDWRAEDFSEKKKLYLLVEFPYPSGDGLHVGHCRSYTALDILARRKRMEGFNVLYPMGWDAFGLPTENYAIKMGVHPAAVTKKNVGVFKKQLRKMGFSFDWSREINTTDPDYYKWTQWIFLKFFEKGLAYRAKMPINWCPSCKIGLANEEVVDGKCERCGAPTEKKEIEQWLLKITKYADRLIDDLEKVDYLEKIKAQQINWIGRSEGAIVKFPISNFQFSNNLGIKNNEQSIEVFTTRVDTIFGATAVVLAPENSIIKDLESRIQNLEEVRKYIEKAKRKTDIERLGEEKEKTGVELKGIKAVNPANGEKIPVWVGDYVVAGYGGGAVMTVPAHDKRDYEFAKKYGLEIREVIIPADAKNFQFPISNFQTNSEFQNLNSKLKEPFVEDGILVNFGRFSGLTSQKARQEITGWLEKNNLGRKTVKYHLRDWIFSRQHYWGEPIPLVFCPLCKKQAENSKFEIRNSKFQFTKGELENPGWIAVPEKDLPVKLPFVKKYQPLGTCESPLAAVKNWVNVKCPKCGGPARRETDTMPNWAGSSWYYLAYLMLGNQKFYPERSRGTKILSRAKSRDKNQKYIWDEKRINYWMPVDIYNGGMEHTTLHLLYSRFWHKFLYDLGLVGDPEPYKRRISHGMVLGEGGIKMSKSRGNVINPDEQITMFGADSLRVYEMFIGPFDEAIPWDAQGIVGARRWLERVWRLKSKILSRAKSRDKNFIPSEVEGQKSKIQIENKKLESLLHRTIKKVTEDMGNFRFNTAISAMMILTNEMEKEKEMPFDVYRAFLIILSPFAPHICEEIWETLGHKKSIQTESWPGYDDNLIKEENFWLIVQVNGAVRDRISAPIDISEGEAKELALKSEAAGRHLAGKEIKKIVFVKNKLINFVV